MLGLKFRKEISLRPLSDTMIEQGISMIKVVGWVWGDIICESSMLRTAIKVWIEDLKRYGHVYILALLSWEYVC